MKTEKNILDLIRKLLGGKINREESEKVNSWYNSFDSSEEVIVESNESKETVKNRMKEKLLQAIGKPEKKGLRLLVFENSYLKAAAAVAAIFILSLTIYLFRDMYLNKPEKLAWIEKQTGMGEKLEILLSDGSKIHLNAGSKIKYTAVNKNSANREIYLEGEAFFDVVHNDKKPFIVRSGNMSITDIGTKFNVKKYDTENETVVSLVEGKVEVFVPSVSKDKKYLSVKQQLCYDNVNQSISIKDFEEGEVVGWLTNRLLFKKESLAKVAVKLERNYGIKFEFGNQAVLQKELTADFRDVPYLTVADAIKEVTGLNYKAVKENERVTKIVFE